MHRLRHALLILAFPLIASAQSTPAIKPAPPFTVARETTLLTEPVRADGSVDYIAAINQTLSKGVTPENNAFVALFEVFGTSRQTLGPNVDELLRLTGGKPSKGLWTGSLPRDETASSAEQTAANERLKNAQASPWNASDNSQWDRWLTDNQPALDLERAAVLRPPYWRPLIPGNDKLLMSAMFYDGSFLKDAEQSGKALHLRAMRSLGSADATAAWKDLLAAHNLAHLLQQDPDLLQFLIGVRIDNATLPADLAIIRDPHVSTEMLHDMLTSLTNFPPTPRVSQVMKRARLYEYPDAVQSMAISFQQMWSAPDSPANYDAARKALDAAGIHFPDWDRILRFGSAFFDKYYDDWPSLPDAERRQRAAEIDAVQAAAEEDGKADDPKNPNSFIFPRKGETRDAYSDRLARHLIAIITPTLDGPMQLVDGQTEHLELTILACALELYYRDHASYPETLAALTPKYLATVPTDFGNQPLEYTHTKISFRLASMGPNFKDLPTAISKDSAITVEIAH
jgi:hypothetical protein